MDNKVSIDSNQTIDTDSNRINQTIMKFVNINESNFTKNYLKIHFA